MAIDQEGALVGMAVAGQNEIDAAGLENGQGVLPHLDELHLGVRVVRAFAVGRMVPIGDDPVLPRGGEICPEPGHHRTVGRAIGLEGIQDDEVDVAVVEGVEGLGAGGNAAGLTVPWEREDVVVGPGLGGGVGGRAVVVAKSRPEHRLSEHRRVHVEDSRLILSVRPAVVGIVAEHQPQIGMPGAGEVEVGVADRGRAGIGRPRVTQNPNTGRFWRARRGSGEDEVTGVVAG